LNKNLLSYFFNFTAFISKCVLFWMGHD
jgi:hypothetical protein